ncbi:MAG: 6,7-dimethyl-8-ribityllumazine synthase [Betaproteobacteria bacterium]|nr:6,7-dimethyl-8-ribityllumazine synthase [Betaproteobacteria bacterium]OGA35885.1 MAG: 6,7-dimethyl-8-ribityllumazine synthase [Betaproteobacteria bacterium RIFCSPLOWO2_12_FULL_64_23]
MREIKPGLNGADLRIGVVRGRFNQAIGAGLLAACLERLGELGVASDRITLVSVPGALEIPLALQQLAASGHYDALIALGAVVRGDTYHFEVVSNESAAGVTQVQLDAGMPVANGILTTDTEEQALARVRQKGGDCAEAAVEMANLAREIRNEKRSA